MITRNREPKGLAVSLSICLMFYILCFMFYVLFLVLLSIPLRKE